MTDRADALKQKLDDLKNDNIKTFESVEDLMNELEEEEC